jgi:hypothetical protein
MKPHLVKHRLAKRSACTCGFPLFDESIQLGTIYTINLADRCTAMLTCGGCGEQSQVECAGTTSQLRPERGFQFAPLKVFEPLERGETRAEFEADRMGQTGEDNARKLGFIK